MSSRCQAVHPPSAASRSLHPERAMVVGSFLGLQRHLDPALLRTALMATLFTTALGNCGPPPPLPFASPLMELNKTDFRSGETLEYMCRPGYIKTGSHRFLTCENSGNWKQSITCVKKRCSNPGEIHNGQINIHTDLFFGSEISFSCLEGYLLVGPRTSFCEVYDKGVAWSKPFPECIVAKCRPPPTISNGKHNGRDKEFYTFGTSVTYSCDPQFSLIGKASISCLVENNTESVWIPSPPICKKVNCLYPEVRHGKQVAGFRRSTFRYKDSLEFDCDYGYKLIGSKVIRCDVNSEWNPDPPVCELNSCVDLPTIPHARWSNNQPLRKGELYPVGTKMEFTCYDGYRASWATTVICQEDLTWSPAAPCEEVCCLRPVLKRGEITDERKSNSAPMCDYFYGDTITYSCYKNQHLTSRCQSDGTWSPEVTCENSCYNVPDIAHGSYEIASRFMRPSEVTFSCETGYKLVGLSKISCNSKGWQAPLCKAVCLRPEITHGQLPRNEFQYLESDSINVSCNSGYRLVGNKTITCTEDRTWSPEVPRCEWEFPAGCEAVSKGWKLMQCLPDPREAKLTLEMYKLSLEIQLLEHQIEHVRMDLLQPPEI